MPVNKNALMRYMILDRCLRDKGRTYGIEDLLKACNEALTHRGGSSNRISLRQIYYDLAFMKAPWGLNAPIMTERTSDGKKFYRYADPQYSIFNFISQELACLPMGHYLPLLTSLYYFKGRPWFDFLHERRLFYPTDFDKRVIDQMDASISKSKNKHLIKSGDAEQYMKLHHALINKLKQ
ncbi:MAG: hypothetical protein N3F09_10170 [Bacteroidia bacterium]|nr:hypothetical protein [Bacteroidia bacterium]